MATEYTSSYWSSEWTTDRARRRADELLDTLAKRALISRNTSGFHWDADEDADLAEFLLSMVRSALQRCCCGATLPRAPNCKGSHGHNPRMTLSTSNPTYSYVQASKRCVHDVLRDVLCIHPKCPETCASSPRRIHSTCGAVSVLNFNAALIATLQAFRAWSQCPSTDLATVSHHVDAMPGPSCLRETP